MSAFDFSGTVPRDVTEPARLTGARFERKVAGVLARSCHGDVGPSNPGLRLDIDQQVAESLRLSRECGRCLNRFYDGRQGKGGLCLQALGGDPEDEPKCLRLLIEDEKAALEFRDPMLVRLWHALSVSWRETKARVGEALQ